MTNVVFKTTLRSTLFMAKLIGLINFSQTLDSDGLFIIYTISTYYSFLEITRMFVLLMCTFIVQKYGFYYIQQIDIYNFWTIIIAARLSALRIIKLINGIIEFDEKLTSLLPTFLVHQRSPDKNCWNAIIIFLSIYYIAFKVITVYLFPPKIFNFITISTYFFSPPSVMEFVVVIISYFYLSNLECRFRTLNDIWKQLSVEIVTVPPGKWTHSSKALLMENVRLLHADLTELLKIFSLGYGQVILMFFALDFINLIITYFFMIFPTFPTSPETNKDENILRNILPYIINLQHVICMMYIIVGASRVDAEKNKIISYLRILWISKLPQDIKLQVKMLMNQVSSGVDEITAFGFFVINLNLVLSILILLISALATLIQMQKHQIILDLINNTQSYVNVAVNF